MTTSKSALNPQQAAERTTLKPIIEIDASTPSTILSTTPHELEHPLNVYVQTAVTQYFAKLEGQLPTNLYDTILHEVEKPLLTVVLTQTNGNQSKAAEVLGLNRGTLRKKLKQYGLM